MRKWTPRMNSRQPMICRTNASTDCSGAVPARYASMARSQHSRGLSSLRLSELESVEW
ncbi:MAG: hypothetical protein ACKVZJ_13270 [Phycisphaerales bacterium]